MIFELLVPQTTKVLAKRPHGDCEDVDEEMNRKINFYAHRFPYSYELCYRSVRQALAVHCNSKCNKWLSVPCNPENITELFGHKISDLICDDFDDDWEHLSKNLPKQCPQQCTLHTYNVKHYIKKET